MTKDIKEKDLLFVVEDSKAYRVLLVCMLREYGFDVMAFEEPAAVLKALEYMQPTVIVSDIEMQDMNGFDMYDAIQAKFPHLNIPIMYVSSTDSPEHIALASKLGASDMLDKPVNPDQLINSVNHIIRSYAA